MEISGAVLRRTPALSGVRSLRDSVSVAAAPSTVAIGNRAVASAGSRGFSATFSDTGHLEYYASPVRCGGGRSKEEKKRAKLVKGLSKDLAALCTMGFGADVADGLAGEVKGKMMTEAAELLMAELKQLRAQEKEMKRKQKEEKKAAKKAAKMKGCSAMKDESSSSSSSESSDDECGNEVLRMSDLRTTPVQELKPETLAVDDSAPKTEEAAEHHIALGPPQEFSGGGSSSSTISASIGYGGNISSTTSTVETLMNKIEVCMGGKCKRSGAMELMEEFGKKIGHEGTVVGCKCMGKCRDGPNVRVTAGAMATGVAAAGAPRNPLCIGVGLEDVATIVANFFGEKDVDLVPA